MKTAQKYRYTLCISFVESKKEVFLNKWDWVLNFKTLHELLDTKSELIDNTVKRHLIIDNITNKKVEIND